MIRTMIINNMIMQTINGLTNLFNLNIMRRRFSAVLSVNGLLAIEKRLKDGLLITIIKRREFIISGYNVNRIRFLITYGQNNMRYPLSTLFQHVCCNTLSLVRVSRPAERDPV